MELYTGVIVLIWVALLILTILVIENNRLSKIQKTVLFVTYITVALAALMEWLGVQFNENTAVPTWLLKMVKYFDYVLTPVCGAIIVLQFRRNGLIQKIMFVVLGVNILLQTISVFTNWMTVIDETTHSYSHGILYYGYIAIYVLILVLTIVEFALYGMKFRRHNQISLYSILVFVTLGIVLQEIFKARVAYAAITIALAFLFIHHAEFSQLSADDKIQEQRILITVDPLTGILNRYAYEKDLSKVDLNDDFVVFSVDINGLKRTNDSLGHHAGDELICGAADVISEVFNKYGRCYRTGGDEFIALSHVDPKNIDSVLKELEDKTKEWSGKEVKELSLSAGAASKLEFPDYTVDDLVGTADQRMYKIKSDYYIAKGMERRRH